MEQIAENINKLFTPKSCFAPFAFDNNGKIIESIRQDLLAKSQAICLKILKQFEALEITNIYLAGSTASYLWRDDSDFDVWIKLKIDYDKFFIKNPNKAIEFLRSYFRAEYNQKKYHCKIGDKKIDIVLNVSIPQKLYGLYDLVNNKWLRKPSQNLLKGQDPEKICNKAIKKFAQIKNEIANLKRNKAGKIAISTICRLHNKHAKIVKSQYTGVEEYLIFKLLRYEGINRIFRDFYNIEGARALSLSEKKFGLDLNVEKFIPQTSEVWNAIDDVLMPQPCLSLAVFDIYGNIIESVRTQLLQRANCFFLRLFGKFDGIKIEEVYLCGSSASYMWNDKSDFDIAIRISVDAKKFIISSPKKAAEFLNESKLCHDRKVLSYKVAGKYVDINFYAEQPKKMYGLYSLSHNKWVVKPQMYLTENVNPQEVYSRVMETINEMNNIVDCANYAKDKYKLAQKLKSYLNILKKSQYCGILEYVVMKVLRKLKIIYAFMQFSDIVLAKIYSIRD